MANDNTNTQIEDAAVDDVEAFKRSDYNALVAQPELLVSSKGKLVSDGQL